MKLQKIRCTWVNQDPLTIAYHDQEWGVAQHDDHILFEFLILEGMQAGLSWYTILKKRDHFRKVFDGFDPKKIKKYSETKIQQLVTDPGIIRNRLKIQATIINAEAFLQVQREHGSFSHYLWAFVANKPLENNRSHHKSIPATTAISDQLSRDLKKRGFKFVGSTICYAFMQAIGMVNDHTVDCFRHEEIKKLNKS